MRAGGQSFPPQDRLCTPFTHAPHPPTGLAMHTLHTCPPPTHRIGYAMITDAEEAGKILPGKVGLAAAAVVSGAGRLARDKVAAAAFTFTAPSS
eukprot:355059-Chlamydomonas_euryale.AAC.2